MVVYMAIGLIALSVVGIAAVVIYYLSTKRKYSKNKKLYQKDQIVIKNKSGFSDILDVIYQNVYLVALKIPIIRYYTKKTRLKLEMVNDYTEYNIRRKTGAIMLAAVFLTFVVLFIVLNVVSDLIMALIVIIFTFIVVDVFVDSRVNKVADKIARQIPEVFTQIRHSFHEHGMIEEAFDDAINELEDKEIMPQIKRIRDAITSDNPEVELERYYDTAPNRFLKLFAGISYLTMELGDRKIDGISVYLKNLNNILNDAYLDILKKDKINERFRSLTIIAVAPLLVTDLLQSWASTNFAGLINFYQGAFGFIIKAFILVSVFAAYFLLKAVKDDSSRIKFDRITTKKWQEKAYRLPIINQIVRGLMPRETTRKYIKKEQQIRNVNSHLTVEWFYVNKLTVSILTFAVVMVIMFNLHYVDIQSIYNRIEEEYLSLGELSDEQKAASDLIAKNDKIVVDELKTKKGLTKDDIRTSMEALGMQPEDSDVDRVYEKLGKVQKAYLKWWQTLIALLCAFISYFIPNLLVFFKNKIRAMEKEDEVMQFQSIILMLMYIERVDVQTMLEWLERYSYYFRQPISTALNNYEAGALEALETLKETVPHQDFKRIVEAFMSAVERIPIKDAFDELETERAFYYERRKAANELLVDRKALIGRVIGFTPLVILIGAYFVAPLLIVSIKQMMTFFTQLG